jgi:regulator of protease activity HflC (stomatin/prohibitin superfamily)
MNTRVAVPVVAAIVVLLIVVMSSVFTVHQTEKALVLQFGNPVR